MKNIFNSNVQNFKIFILLFILGININKSYFGVEKSKNIHNYSENNIDTLELVKETNIREMYDSLKECVKNENIEILNNITSGYEIFLISISTEAVKAVRNDLQEVKNNYETFIELGKNVEWDTIPQNIKDNFDKLIISIVEDLSQYKINDQKLKTFYSGTIEEQWKASDYCMKLIERENRPILEQKINFLLDNQLIKKSNLPIEIKFIEGIKIPKFIDNILNIIEKKEKISNIFKKLSQDLQQLKNNYINLRVLSLNNSFLNMINNYPKKLDLKKEILSYICTLIKNLEKIKDNNINLKELHNFYNNLKNSKDLKNQDESNIKENLDLELIKFMEKNNMKILAECQKKEYAKEEKKESNEHKKKELLENIKESMIAYEENPKKIKELLLKIKKKEEEKVELNAEKNNIEIIMEKNKETLTEAIEEVKRNYENRIYETDLSDEEAYKTFSENDKNTNDKKEKEKLKKELDRVKQINKNKRTQFNNILKKRMEQYNKNCADLIEKSGEELSELEVKNINIDQEIENYQKTIEMYHEKIDENEHNIIQQKQYLDKAKKTLFDRIKKETINEIENLLKDIRDQFKELKNIHKELNNRKKKKIK